MAFGTYLLITIVLTAIQMGVIWWQERTALVRELALLTESYCASLSKAVWNLDQSQINSILQGLFSLPSISGVKLEYAGEERRLGEVQGEISQSRSLTVPLNPPKLIGVLTVYARSVILLERVKLSYGVLIFNAMLKTVALWLILTWFGNRLIGRPLAELTRHMADLHLSHIHDDRERVARLMARLERSRSGDELERLAGTFVRMTESLAESKASLDRLRQDLEHEVEQRTRQLQRMNVLLRQKNKALLKLSTTDPLTGVANRLRLDQILTEEIVRTQRYGNDLSLILLDVDHFKTINDTCGHRAGDHVLQQLCRVLKSRLRSTDVLGRWGGEEFLIVAVETPLAAARMLAEKLRIAVATHDFGIDRSVSASFGVAVYRQGETQSCLLDRVDSALYRAKNEGRNRVAVELGEDNHRNEPGQE